MCKRKKVEPFGNYDVISLTFIRLRGRTPLIFLFEAISIIQGMISEFCLICI